MCSWLVQRLATSLIYVFLLISAVFFIVRLAPGDPVDQFTATELSAADRALIRRQLGLDGRLFPQYRDWIGDVARGDFGVSLRQQRPVSGIVREAFGATLLLTAGGYALHLLCAFGAALSIVHYRGRWPARGLRNLGLALYSVPAFWLGLMLTLLLSGRLHWFPAAGMYSPDAELMTAPQRLLDLLHHLFLPALAIGLSTFMGTARYIEAGLEDALSQDYVLAARSRGVPERVILTRHALRNALLPVITLVGLTLPALLGGAVVIETVFGWPGMGRVTIEAVWARDYPVIMATSLVAAVAVTLGSLLADVGYRLADPRVSYGRGRELR